MQMHNHCCRGSLGMIWASSFLICEQDPATTAEEHEIELSLLTHYILQSQESLGIKDVSNEKWRVYLCQILTVIPLFPIQYYSNLSRIIQVCFIFMNSYLYVNITKVIFVLFPFHNYPPLRNSLKSTLSLILNKHFKIVHLFQIFSVFRN